MIDKKIAKNQKEVIFSKKKYIYKQPSKSAKLDIILKKLILQNVSKKIKAKFIVV